MDRRIRFKISMGVAIAACTLLSLALKDPPAQACTSFLIQRGQELVFGKSYDWDIDHGIVLFNKQGVGKKALLLRPDLQPVKWISKYASLTFNQYGREFPNGGMNQAGLVIEIMWLNESSYPASESKPALNELQWIQYHLDTCATLAEVVKQAGQIWIVPAYAKVHYLVCDRSAACAAFEYLEGKLQITQGQDLVQPVLTNNSYADSAAFLKTHLGFGGNNQIPKSAISLDRFARAASLLQAKAPAGQSLKDQAFSILDSVSQGDYSKWNMVYDPITLKVYFRTLRQRLIKEIDFNQFDTSCITPASALDINFPSNSKLPINVTGNFSVCTDEINRSLLEKSLNGIRDKLPPMAIEMLTGYPRMLPCTTETKKIQ